MPAANETMKFAKTAKKFLSVYSFISGSKMSSQIEQWCQNVPKFFVPSKILFPNLC